MSAFRRLIGECAATPGRLALVVASFLVLSVGQLGLTWLAKLWAEALTGPDPGAAVRGILTVAAILTGAVIVAVFASRYLLVSLSQRVLERLRNAVQSRLVRARLDRVGSLAGGELLSRVFNDVTIVGGFADGVLKRLVGQGFVIVGAVTMMFVIEWRLALATFVVVPPLVLVAGRLGRRIRRRGRAAQAEIGGLVAMAAEQIRGLSTIKGFRTERVEETRFVHQNARYRTQVLRSEWLAAALVAAVWCFTGAWLLGVLGWGSVRVVAGQLTAGDLLAFSLYAVQTIEPLRRMSDVQGLLQRILAAADRVYEIVDAPWVESEGMRALPSPVRGEIRLEGLAFAYRGGEPVLRGVDLVVRPRDMVGLVAASGGGKTTIGRLLQRFHDPTGGRVLLDGIDLRDLRLESLRRAVLVVEQEPFVFAGSLRDNVRYGSWDAPARVVDAAIRMTGLDVVARTVPGGLDGELREGGANLSGGQRQRISLARAIVRDPAVLVLDEATSAIDGETEERIFATLGEWLGRRTVLVFAHRFATIARLGRVVVLEEGRVTADGSVAELLETAPPFARLFADQLSGRTTGEPAGPDGIIAVAK